MKRQESFGKNSINRKLLNLSLTLLIPPLCMCLIISIMFAGQRQQYKKISGNISTVSGFNQNFKNDVDLMMYQFVAGSDTRLPLDEVEEAKSMAEALISTTTNRDSLKAIASISNLADNLAGCINEIVAIDGYDQRMNQLENNVYVITSLIQKYLYTYLYYEAGEQTAVQEKMNFWFTVQMISIAVLLAALVLLSIRTVLKTSRSITQPIDALYRRVQDISRGELAVRTPVEASDDKLQTLSNALEEMVGKLNEHIELNRREQLHLRSMELSLLQAQINPHFLYNTLDAMVWLIEAGKNDQAVEMVSSLSTYFRTSLSNGKEIIPLSEELLHIRSYLEIQQTRYKDILRYDIDVSPALGGCRIPKMTLQPLVENAIYHGIKVKRGVGTVRISGMPEGDTVRLEVSDTGVGMPLETLERIRSGLNPDDVNNFGIFAVWQRLRLTFGGSVRLDIESEENIGTTVCLRFPYTTFAEASQ